MTLKIITRFFLILGLVATSAFTQNFEIIPSNSKVMFKITHLGISTVTGTFDNFNGSFVYDAKKKIFTSILITMMRFRNLLFVMDYA